MKNEMLKLLMMQSMADIKDEFMNDLREVIKDVIQKELIIMDRNVIQANSRLTYDDIVKEYKVSKNTLIKLKRAGKLIPITKGGRNFIFDRTHVEACLRDRPRIPPNFGSEAA